MRCEDKGAVVENNLLHFNGQFSAFVRVKFRMKLLRKLFQFFVVIMTSVFGGIF